MLFRKKDHSHPPRLELVADYSDLDEGVPLATEKPDLLADLQTDIPDLDELAVRRVARSILSYEIGEVNDLIVFDQDSATSELAKVIQLFPTHINPVGEITEQS